MPPSDRLMTTIARLTCAVEEAIHEEEGNYINIKIAFYRIQFDTSALSHLVQILPIKKNIILNQLVRMSHFQ